MKKTLIVQESPSATHNPVTIAQAESILRAIAKRNGHSIRKRRSRTLKEIHGAGYGIVDASCNILLSGGSTSDGCDFYLVDVAKFYRGDEFSTARQNKVIAAIIADQVVD